MKLNLGCGQRCFPDYLNVDLDARPDASYPYLQADVATLPLDDGVASEILSVHVIEHIWPWEALDLLKEWHRVLASGGVIAIECPNLANVSAMFSLSILSGSPDMETMLMNCFYGDPKDRDLPGRHKWGYTPKSLAKLLHQTGFKNIRQEKAQFKMKEPRDMRIVGEKV